VDSLPATTSNIDANQDNDTIRDHAGWAIKRARDVIFKGQNELPAKATVDEDSPVIFGSKTDALAVLSLLGEDKKQPDDSYRFSIYEHVIPFLLFVFLELGQKGGCRYSDPGMLLTCWDILLGEHQMVCGVK
jgi:hypothetical protein